MSQKQPVCRIKVSNGKNSRSEEIEKSSFTIGRGDHADFRIATAGVSRSHLSIEVIDGEIWLKDLGSSNGTKLSGKKLPANEPVKYKEGEPVILGLDQNVLTFTALVGKVDDTEEVEVDVEAEVELPPLPNQTTPPPQAPRVRAESVISKVVAAPPKPAPPVDVPVLNLFDYSDPAEGADALPVVPAVPKKSEFSLDEDSEPVEHTVVDPKFKKAIQAQNQAMQEQVLEEAKGSALKLKIAATTEAAKITQEAKDRARNEVAKAREQADQILEKATEQAVALQRKSESEANALREAMQEAIAKVHAEFESKAESMRRESREKGETIIEEYEAKAEKLLSAARVSATVIKGDAQKEADTLIGTAIQRASDLKIASEVELKALLREEKRKAADLVGDAQNEADQILMEARNASTLIRKNIEVELSSVRKQTQDEAAKIRLEAQEEAADLVVASQQQADAQKLETARLKESTDKLVAELTTKAESALTTAQAEAEKESRLILARSRREAKAQKTELDAARELAEKEVAELRLAAQNEVAGLKSSAHQKADAIVNLHQKEIATEKAEIEKIKSLALKEAKELKAQAEAESEEILARNRKLMDSHQAELDKLTRQAEKAASELKNQAEADANQIRVNALKEVEAQKKGIELIIEGAHKEAAEIKAQGRISGAELLKAAQENANKKQAELLQLANAEIQEHKDEGFKAAEAENAKILANVENERTNIQSAIEKLKVELTQNEAKAKQVSGQNSVIEEKNRSLQAEFEKLSLKLSESQAEAHEEIADLKAQIETAQKTLSSRTTELDKVTSETKRIREQVANADDLLKKNQDESDLLTASVATLKKTEAQLKKEVDTQTQFIDGEKKRLRALVEREIQTYKDESMSEVKGLREKAQADFKQRKSEQDEELARMRMTELEIIKGLRGLEEAKFAASRKHHTLEISKALESFLVPRLKEGMASAQFFPELKQIVGKVLDSYIPGPLSQAPAATGLRNKRNVGIVAGLAMAIALVLAYLPFRNDATPRKPASDIFLERLKQKQAERPQFNPPLTDTYKPSYTENVLYTRDYLDFKLNPDNQARWIKELNHYFVNNLNLNENTIVKFISVESSLVSQLKDLRAVIHIEHEEDDIAKMTSLEKSTTTEILDVLGTERNYRAFRAFEKSYFERNRAPASVTPPSTSPSP